MINPNNRYLTLCTQIFLIFSVQSMLHVFWALAPQLFLKDILSWCAALVYAFGGWIMLTNINRNY